MVVSSDTYPEYIGAHTITTSAAEQSFHVTIAGDETEEVYRFCDQDFLERVSALLHFFQLDTSDWMSPDQQVLTYIFGILCVALLVILGCVAIVFDLMPNMRAVSGDYVRLSLPMMHAEAAFLLLPLVTVTNHAPFGPFVNR